MSKQSDGDGQFPPLTESGHAHGKKKEAGVCPVLGTNGSVLAGRPVQPSPDIVNGFRQRFNPLPGDEKQAADQQQNQEFADSLHSMVKKIKAFWFTTEGTDLPAMLRIAWQAGGHGAR